MKNDLPYNPVNFGTGKEGIILQILYTNRVFIPDYTPEQEALDRAELEKTLKPGMYFVTDEGIQGPK